MAEEAGAQIHLGYQFEGFFQAGKKMVLNLRNLKKDKPFTPLSDILVGADGASSAVARAISYDGHIPTTLLQARVALPKEGASDTCQVWFDPDYTKYFFWSIPECSELSTIGLIAEDDRQARAGLEAFLKERGLKPLEFQGAKVPLYRWSGLRGGESWRGGVFLVGDAAAQVKVTTVGGVVTGLYGAKALANVLTKGGNYQKELRMLTRELNLHLFLRRILNKFRDEDYDELIEMLKGRLKDLLQTWSRDELRRFFLKMILIEPRMISIVAKAFIRSANPNIKNLFIDKS